MLVLVPKKMEIQENAPWENGSRSIATEVRPCSCNTEDQHSRLCFASHCPHPSGHRFFVPRPVRHQLHIKLAQLDSSGSIDKFRTLTARLNLHGFRPLITGRPLLTLRVKSKVISPPRIAALAIKTSIPSLPYCASVGPRANSSIV